MIELEDDIIFMFEIDFLTPISEFYYDECLSEKFMSGKDFSRPFLVLLSFLYNASCLQVPFICRFSWILFMKIDPISLTLCGRLIGLHHLVLQVFLN